MLKTLNHENNVRFILDNAQTTFLPLEKEYKITYSPQKIIDIPHMRIWMHQEFWDEIKYFKEPSKICLINYKDVNFKNVYTNILKNKCSLIENFVIDCFRYILIRPPRVFDVPEYDFKSVGANILLHCGGGYGDFFSSLRYIQLYKSCNFVVETNPNLYSLFEKTKIFKQVIFRGQKCKVDFHLPINRLVQKHGSCGHLVPFINNIEKNKNVNGGIGFCFMGNRVKYSLRRTFDYNMLKEFSRFNLYNLQKEVRNIDFAKNLSIDDWLDTAQIIQGCDLIVSPPTAIMHLAGGMGKKVFVVFQNFHYQIEKDYFNHKSSNFYPSLCKVHVNQLKPTLRKYVKNKYK